MAAKLSLAKLMAQVENGELSAEKAKRYFVIDKTSRVAFSPALRFNPRTVDITGLESSAEAVATALARDIDLADARARAAERPRSFALKAYGASDAVAAAELGATILAEGDSWFDLPPFIYPRTLIDFLGRTHRVVTLAKFGDTLERMIAKKEFVEPLRTGAFKHFLFSGGGNDIVGGGHLEVFLRQFDIGHTDPSDAAWYVNDQFVVALDRVIGLYKELARIVRRESPSTKLLVHGYDYAIPQRDGPWLGKGMEFRGLHPAHRPELCRAIVKVMIDAFNARLALFAQQSGGDVIHVNLRSITGSREWYDELHAREVATERFAQAFEGAISP